MYTIHKSYVKQNYEFAIKDISEEKLKDVLLDYQSVKIQVKWNDQKVIYAFKLKDNLDAINLADKNLTVKAWLASFTEDSLVLTPNRVGLTGADVVKTFDLRTLNGEFTVGNVGYGKGVEIPTGLETDLIFKTFDELNNEDSTVNLHKHCLFAANGRIVRSFLRDNRCYLRGAASTLLLERSTGITVIDFTDIGGIKRFYPDEDNVRVVELPEDSSVNPTHRSVVVTLPEKINGRTPFIVLDGFLHLLDGTYDEIDDNKIEIKVDVRQAIMRDLMKPKSNGEFYDKANSRGAGAIPRTFDAKKYVVETESMVVLLRDADLGIMKERLTDTGLPQEYLHHRAPKGIVFFDDHTVTPYRISGYNSHNVSISTSYNRKREYLVDTDNWEDVNSFTQKEMAPTKDNVWMGAFVIEMYRF